MLKLGSMYVGWSTSFGSGVGVRLVGIRRLAVLCGFGAGGTVGVVEGDDGDDAVTVGSACGDVDDDGVVGATGMPPGGGLCLLPGA